MPNNTLELLIGLLQCVFGIYVIWRKQFSVEFCLRWFLLMMWGERQHIYKITGFRAVTFGAVNIAASIVIIVPLLAMQLLGNFAVSPAWLLLASIEITVISYIAECLFELLYKRQQRKYKLKNDARYVKNSFSFGDDCDLTKPIVRAEDLESDHKSKKHQA